MEAGCVNTGTPNPNPHTHTTPLLSQLPPPPPPGLHLLLEVQMETVWEDHGRNKKLLHTLEQ